MSDITVVFVKQEGEPDHEAMLRAFQSSSDDSATCVWIPEQECMQMHGRHRTKIFIFAKFDGAAFKHLASSNNRIYGPRLILGSAERNEPLPKVTHPVHNVAMKGLTVCITNAKGEFRDILAERIQWMCGECSRVFHDRVSYLIAGEVNSKKYQVAAQMKSKIMMFKWVEKVWEESQTTSCRADDPEFEQYRCPIFHGCDICISGFETPEREEVVNMIETNGGNYKKNLVQKECSHLVVKQAGGRKFEAALKWKIPVVNKVWLDDSVNAGYCQELHKYKYSQTNPKDSNKVTSTPTPDDSRLSVRGPDISCISVTTVNETTMNCTVTPVSDPLDDLKLSTVKSGMFLDGCKIYISGFTGARLEKLRKLINLGGGTRFSQINDTISHVVMGDRVEADIRVLDSGHFRPHVVGVTWVIQCAHQGTQVPEEDYLALLPQPESNSPIIKLPKRTSRTSSLSTSRRERSMLNSTGDAGGGGGGEAMMELLSQYVNTKNDETDESALLRAVESAEQDQEVPNPTDSTLKDQQDVTVADHHIEVDHHATGADDDDATQDPSEDTTCIEMNMFQGKSFVIIGMPIDEHEEMTKIIEQCSGTVLDRKSRTVADYAVVPPLGCEVTVTAAEIVTSVYILVCYEEECLLPVTETAVFTPISIQPDVTPLVNCVISISGYKGPHRECLQLVAERLGAICQESFGKVEKSGHKANTHLIVNAPEGSKYEAAKRWNLHALHEKWLIECARTGKRLKESLYDIASLEEKEEEEGEEGEEEEGFNDTTIDEGTVSHNTSKNNTVIEHETPTEDRNEPNVQNDPPNEGTTTPAAHSTPVSGKPAHGRPSDTKFATPVTVKPAHGRPSDTKLATPVDVTPGHGRPSDTKLATPVDVTPGHGRPSDTKLATPVDVTPGHDRPADIKSATPVRKRTPCLDKTNMKKERPTSTSRTPLMAKLHPSKNSPMFNMAMRAGTPKTPGTSKGYFDVDEYLADLQTPDCEKKKFDPETPVDEMFSKYIDIAFNRSKAIEGQGTPANLPAPHKIFKAKSGPLTGVVIGVSKKLVAQQSEFNNIVADLGADYRWIYDQSCTHFVFEGRLNDANKEFRQAREHGKHIVSPYWLYICKEQNAHVDESLFPHTYNPSLSLAVTSSKGTPARTPRRSTRSRHKSEEAATASPVRMTRARNKPSMTDVTEDTKHHSPPKKPRSSEEEVEEEGEEMGEGTLEAMKIDFTDQEIEETTTTEEKSSDEEKAGREAVPNMEDLGKKTTRRKAPCTQPMNTMARVALVDEMKHLMAATKTDLGKRRTRRTDSISSSADVSMDEPETKRLSLSHQSDKSDEGRRRSHRSSKSKLTEESQSQMPEVTWDDPQSRAQQEILAAELAKNSQTVREPVDTDSSDDTQDGSTDQEAELEKPKYFLFSSITTEERTEYSDLVKELGGHVLVLNHYDPKCTHLVTGSPSRNEKFLASVASGIWVLQKSYLESCRNAKAFVPEEEHEWGSPATVDPVKVKASFGVKLAKSAYRWRKHLTKGSGAFSGWKCLLLTSESKVSGFRRLLEAGGAQVLADIPNESFLERDLNYAFVDSGKQKSVDLGRLTDAGVHCVKSDYIASYLYEDPIPPPQSFYISAQSESSKRKSTALDESDSKRARLQ